MSVLKRLNLTGPFWRTLPIHWCSIEVRCEEMKKFRFYIRFRPPIVSLKVMGR